MMKIQLEVLTRNNIKFYVHSKLVKDQLFSQLRAREEERCDKLVREVVDKANGVFLWVFLIVRSLLQGLTNVDRIVDLQKRLRYLPADLETYFEHMLGTLEDFYKQQTAQTFQIALHALESLSLTTYVMLDELDDHPECVIELVIGVMDAAEVNELKTG